MFDWLLRHDLDYLYYTKTQGRKLSFLFKTRLVLKNWIRRFLPGFISKGIIFLIEYNYFYLHKFRWSHLKELYKNHKNKVVKLSFQSGFGDMLQTLPYYKAIKEKHPDFKVVSVIHHPDHCVYDEMSFCKASTLTTPSGEEIDYLKECLENNPYIDEVEYNDCWGDGIIYSWPPLIRFFYGEQRDPGLWHESVGKYWNTKEDLDQIQKIWDDNNLKQKIVLALHVKTAADFLNKAIVELVQKLKGKHPQKKVFIIAAGKVDFNMVQQVHGLGAEVFDVSGSYSKGINTRVLVKILSMAHLFFGGRGGFNNIQWCFGTPTMNVFDFQGKQECLTHTPAMWWEKNIIGEVFWEESTTVEAYVDKAVHYLEENVIDAID